MNYKNNLQCNSSNIATTPSHYGTPPSKRIRLNEFPTSSVYKSIGTPLIASEKPNKIGYHDSIKRNPNLIEIKIVTDETPTNDKMPSSCLKLNNPIIQKEETENYSKYNTKSKETVSYNQNFCDIEKHTNQHFEMIQKGNLSHATKNTMKQTASIITQQIEGKINRQSPIINSVMINVDEPTENKTIKKVIQGPNGRHKQKDNKSGEFRKIPSDSNHTESAQKPNIENNHRKSQKSMENRESSPLLDNPKSSCKKLKIVLDVIYVTENEKNIQEYPFSSTVNEDDTTNFLDEINVDEIVACLKKCENKTNTNDNTTHIDKNKLHFSNRKHQNSLKNKQKETTSLFSSVDITLVSDIKPIINKRKLTLEKNLQEIIEIENNNCNSESTNMNAENTENVYMGNMENVISASVENIVEKQDYDIESNNNVIKKGENTEFVNYIENFTFDTNIEKTENKSNHFIVDSNNVSYKKLENTKNYSYIRDSTKLIKNETNSIESISRNISIANGNNTENVDNIKPFKSHTNLKHTVLNQDNNSKIKGKNIINRNEENTKVVDNAVQQTIIKQDNNGYIESKTNNGDTTQLSLDNNKQIDCQVLDLTGNQLLSVAKIQFTASLKNVKNVNQNIRNDQNVSLEKAFDKLKEATQISFKLDNSDGINNALKVIKTRDYSAAVNDNTENLKSDIYYLAMEELNKPISKLHPKLKVLAEAIEIKLSKIFREESVFDHIINKNCKSTIMCFKRLHSKNITHNYTIKMLCNKKDKESYGLHKAKLLYKLQYSNSRENYNCVRLYEHFNIFGHYCFVMEYYPMNLKQYMDKQKKSLHINNVKILAKQLSNAVSILHNKGIIHTDIKPTHILVNSNCDKLKMCGFDQANYLSRIELSPYLGTANYRAPEVIIGYSVGHPIDVWATALVLYEMATNRQLFPGRYNNDILFKHMCTLGNLPQDMLCNSKFSNIYFSGTTFMRTVGLKKVTQHKYFIKSIRIVNTLYRTYINDWSHLRCWSDRSKDYNELNSFYKLLEQMLHLDPNFRLPIEFLKQC